MPEPRPVVRRAVRRWLATCGGAAAGVILGSVLGAFVSINVLDVGYEATLGDIWREHNAAMWVMSLVGTAGGTVGGALAWRRSAPKELARR